MLRHNPMPGPRLAKPNRQIRLTFVAVPTREPTNAIRPLAAVRRDFTT